MTGLVAVRSHDRAARVAGGAAAVLAGALVLWLVILVAADGTWLSTHYSQPRGVTEATRVAVGVAICALGVLLLADRYAHRLGGVVLAAGSVWLIPSILPDVLSFTGAGAGAGAGVIGGGGSGGGGGGATVAAAVTIAVKAVGFAGRAPTVLLFPLVFADGVPRWLRHAMVAGALGWYGTYAAVWAVGTPGAVPFASPWGETTASEWARGLLGTEDAHEPWVRYGLTVAMVAGLAMAAYSSGTRQKRRVAVVLAVVHPLIAFLLLSEIWSGDVAFVVARLAGGVLWGAVICVVVVRGGLWRLDRATGHRLAAASVATVVGALLLGGTTLFWATVARDGVVTPIAIGCALLVGFTSRQVMRRATRRVERAFYGRRARPQEAVLALAARLREAPSPGEVPEQICRSAVEDLGLSGAEVSVDTTTGPRRLASAGAPLISAVQHFRLSHHGRTVGRLSVARDAASTPVDRDSHLLALLADQAAPALAALRLAEEARAARERLVLAREEEHRHLRREIHDGLGPQLAAVQLWIGTAQAHPSEAEEQLRTAAEQLGEALREVRRITTGLAPAALVDRGLSGAVADLAHRFGTERTAVAVDVRPEPLPDVPAGVEMAAYRIVSEALTNAIRHSGARHIRITVEADETTLTVTVGDDGTGLPDHPVPGTGLASLRGRAEEIGGSCEVTSTSNGVLVRAALPITI